MAEGARFEFQSPPLRIDGMNLVWVTTNTGDATAEPGTEIDIVRVFRRATANVGEVDTTPWQFDVPVNGTVEPGTAHSATFTLEWPGLDDGAYEAQVSLQQGKNDVWANAYIRIERGWPKFDLD